MPGRRMAGVFDKFKIAGPADRLRVDAKRRDLHRLFAVFVVKHESAARPADAERPALRGYCDLRTPGAIVSRDGRQRPWVAQRIGHGDAQRPRHADRGFGMHVLVKQHQTPEIQRAVIGGCGGRRVTMRLQQRQGLLQACGQFRPGGVQPGQRQIPARGMRHPARVVQGVGIGPSRGAARVQGIAGHAPRALAIALDPPRLEPGHMAPFPQRRIEAVGTRHLQIGQGLGPRIDEPQRACAAALEQRGQRGSVGPPRSKRRRPASCGRCDGAIQHG